MNNMIRVVKQGSPTYLAPWYKTLSPAAKRMVGEESAPLFRNSRADKVRDIKQTAITYAKVILAQRGIALPNGDCRPEAIWGNEKAMQVRAVVWHRHVYNRATKSHDFTEVLRFDIPHWDHVPTVTDCNSTHYAIAAE